jgi:hypothetical protein
MGARSVIDALPTALATSVGRSGTCTCSAPTSGATSISRTEPCASASTIATCGKVIDRSSGFTKKRSETSTRATSRFGSRNVTARSGVTNTARQRAWCRQNAESSARSSIDSATEATAAFGVPISTSCRSASVARLPSSVRSASPFEAGSVGT